MKKLLNYSIVSLLVLVLLFSLCACFETGVEGAARGVVGICSGMPATGRHDDFGFAARCTTPPTGVWNSGGGAVIGFVICQFLPGFPGKNRCFVSLAGNNIAAERNCFPEDCERSFLL